MSNAPKDEDQLARFGEELKDRTWLANARQRSQRRRSAWNLLLPLLGFPLWGVIAALLAWLASSFHSTLYPMAPHLFQIGAPLRLGAALVLLPSLVAAVCPALLLTNMLVYLIPSARLAMDTEDRNYPGTGYNASQLALRKMASWGLFVWLPVVLVGAFLK